MEYDVSMTCAKYLSAMKVNRTLLCERESLTANVADLVPICTPSAKETLGMWLEDMPNSSARGTLCGRKIMSFVSSEINLQRAECVEP